MPDQTHRDPNSLLDEIASDSKATTEVDLFDFLLILAKHWKKIVLAPIVASLVGYGLTYALPNEYSAIARVTPPLEPPASTAALTSQIGTLASLAGIGVPTNPSDVVAGLLASQTVLDAVISKFGLKEIYNERTLLRKYFKKPTLIKTREDLTSAVKVSVGKDDGIVTIEVLDQDVQLAVKIANTFVTELRTLTKTIAAGEARDRRTLYEAEVKNARNDLTSAESKLRSAQESTGLIDLNAQAQAIIENIARLRADIISKEIQISSTRTFATERNPDYARQVEELSRMRGELEKLEKSNLYEQGNVLVATAKIPELSLEVVRSMRDVKFYSTLLAALETQYALAKIDELREPSVVQVVDFAVPVDEETRPYRKTIAAATFALTLVMAMVYAFASEALLRYRSVPAQAEKIDRLLALLRWTRSKQELS